MEKETFLPMFLKYHERVLADYEGVQSTLEGSLIFNKVMEEFPLEMLRVANVSTAGLGPCEEYVLDMLKENPAQFEAEKYYPSKSTLMGVFWGMYLEKLVETKGYPQDPDVKLNDFIRRGREQVKDLSLVMRS